MSLDFLQGRTHTVLRIALGSVFVWTGVLKLFNVSPVNEMLVKAIPGLGESQVLLFVFALLEILIGASLLANKFVRFAAIIMCLHLFILTIAILFTQGFVPRFPILSLAGEYALKNIVLVAAGFFLIVHKEEKHLAHDANEEKHHSDPEGS